LHFQPKSTLKVLGKFELKNSLIDIRVNFKSRVITI